jgi:Zn-dependent M28 family amino/carboxypeptidase
VTPAVRDGYSNWCQTAVSVPATKTSTRPGANDDASGTAVSLGCARVLSKLKFPATIIFLTVAGEEQGLNGSRHFTAMAKQQGWKIEAVLNNDIVGGDRSPQQDAGVVGAELAGVGSQRRERGSPGPAVAQRHDGRPAAFAPCRLRTECEGATASKRAWHAPGAKTANACQLRQGAPEVSGT